MEWRETGIGSLRVSRAGQVMGAMRRPLAFKRRRDGYLEFTTRLHGKRLTLRVHQLVARAFCRGFKAGRQVNHRNGDKRDNRACNLEWVTPRGNVRHAMSLGNFPLGERNGQSRLTRSRVAALRAAARRGEGVRSLGLRFGVSFGQAARVVRREAWSSVE